MASERTTRKQENRYPGSQVSRSYPNGKTPQKFPLSEVARGDTNILNNNRRENSDSGREREYEEFFRLYAVLGESKRCPSLQEGLKGKKNGVYLLPLGFVPGLAVLLKFQSGQVRVVSATKEARPEMEIASDWGSADSLPEKVQEGIERQRSLINGLGCEPSPWALGLASRLLKEGAVPVYLAMGFTAFRWENEEQPFGLVLVPTENEGEVEVSRVYNPAGLDAPVSGTRITTEDIQFGGTSPLAKLLRAWAKMENAARKFRFPR